MEEGRGPENLDNFECPYRNHVEIGLTQFGSVGRK